MPDSDAALQERRAWELKFMRGVHRNLRSPRARKKVKEYVSKRQKTECNGAKAAIVKEYTSLKSEGGLLDGGDHPETYNAVLLKKVVKKAQKKEAKAKAKIIKDMKKWAGIEKMKATTKTKKM